MAHEKSAAEPSMVPDVQSPGIWRVVPDVISKKDMVDKIDPILLLIGTQPEQKIRQICQEEMVRYGVIDSYSVSSNRRGHG